ncbi:hypothetical protein I553_8832 [Mycobacterium xenopi 4042]|uniref:Uncharacterized protein n=1 Tax=Mycobacterium xenopi 4042 TaxID=1299334 RepID=X8CMX7_MYCXE|nr:hypothetical protein I553_8832 [Mycobacterium xenopi 4042]
MGLFGKRKTRAIRRAEARAIKQRAKLDAKLAAKNEARRIKSAQRAEAKALKAQLKASVIATEQHSKPPRPSLRRHARENCCHPRESGGC